MKYIFFSLFDRIFTFFFLLEFSPLSFRKLCQGAVGHSGNFDIRVLTWFRREVSLNRALTRSYWHRSTGLPRDQWIEQPFRPQGRGQVSWNLKIALFPWRPTQPVEWPNRFWDDSNDELSGAKPKKKWNGSITWALMKRWVTGKKSR